ncbi:MAG: GNAT family N-acetyltransferase [Phenylobacterium sp.]|jgi:GNAT superfamily N-acetyltransferase|uniref:GNAT family N-acetyltransferase n=1 Tax=Phenylobacterium sp. TaxID=1871053 RepID=UPI00391A0F91
MTCFDGLALRPAHISEIELVREIERASAQRFVGTDRVALADDEPTDAETLARRVGEGGLLVASETGAPVAFVMFREVEACGYIEQIDVLPAHAGRRIGAALIDAVADEGRQRGWTTLTLSTFKDVPWNAPYYRRLGFVDIAEAALTPGLLAIREAHLARGLDESSRVFLRRAL